MVEGGLRETGLAVTGRAVFAEDAAVRVAMTVRAPRGRETDLDGALDVTLRAGNRRVRAHERIAGLPVIDCLSAKSAGRMAALAAAERLPVRVAMAVGAGGESRDPVSRRPVALLALDLRVSPREPEGRAVVVEGRAGFLERLGRRVTPRAVGAQSAAVNVGMTRRAGGIGREVRPGPVARRAREAGVFAVQRKPGLFRVIESTAVEPRDPGIRPRMFGVARHAGSSGIPVDALFRRDAVRDRSMAGEAPGRRHLLARLVTFLAILQTFEASVRFRKRARRDQAAGLLGADRRGAGEGERQDDRDEGAANVLSVEAPSRADPRARARHQRTMPYPR